MPSVPAVVDLAVVVGGFLDTVDVTCGTAVVGCAGDVCVVVEGCTEVAESVVLETGEEDTVFEVTG